jgi:hypothetical protein
MQLCLVAPLQELGVMPRVIVSNLFEIPAWSDRVRLKNNVALIKAARILLHDESPCAWIARVFEAHQKVAWEQSPMSVRFITRARHPPVF